MTKDIQFSGYATEPSDYECPDGQLAASLNIISEDNQLKPVFQPAAMAEMPQHCKVVFIHDTGSFTHFIIHDTDQNALYWIDESVVTQAEDWPVPETVIAQEMAGDSPSHLLHQFASVAYAATPLQPTIISMSAVGNTLLVLTPQGMHYILWKGDDEGYLYLGTHLPELSISFGLQGEMVRSESFEVESQSSFHPSGTFGGSASSDDDEDDDEEKEKQRILNETVLAKVNKFIAEETVQKGRFIYPFFVRYAYRLYDGDSLTMQSAPVLMPCSNVPSPKIVSTPTPNSNKREAWVTDMVQQLDYKVEAGLDELRNWGDIVKSIDIYISAPIYNYDQNGDVSIHNSMASTPYYPANPLPYAVCKYDNSYARHNVYSKYAAKWGSTFGWFMSYAPEKETFYDDIRKCCNFYFLKSYPLEELSEERTLIDIGEDHLQSLTSRETLDDDYDSHDKLIPSYAYAYNSRLSLANLKKSLYQGQCAALTNAYASGSGELSTFFFIRQGGKHIIVQSTSVAYAATSLQPSFVFYPNTNAYKAVIYDHSSGDYWEVQLKPHDFLNGSFFFDEFGTISVTRQNAVPCPWRQSEDTTIQLPNKLYTSEVNNPFTFPLSGINTVGTGTILALATAAKALSQGQHGQFPLYAFTTEGVWSMEVSKTGLYSAGQNITRDVCINTDSITQLDTEVLFATDRGIMLISGSHTTCVSDSIFAQNPFNVLDLPGMSELHERLGHASDTCLPTKPFLNFLKECRMLFDYIHQRVIVFNPQTTPPETPTVSYAATPLQQKKYTYAYVFSLKSKAWGMTFSDIASTINSYPDALAMTHEGMLVSFSVKGDTTCKALYVTRPLKLDGPDIMKTVSTVIQRGHFQKGDVSTVLYASRDLYSWHLVWSSKDHYLRGFRGTPYKYFRLAAIATLTEGKSIFGASVAYEPRHTNQMR